MAASYSTSELMVVRAARELLDGEVVFVGIGLPNLACNLARHTHAPNLTLIYESGAVGSVPDRLPLSIGDPCLVKGAAAVCSIFDVFQYYLVNEKIDVGFLGAAQMDRYGNINTTVIGNYKNPKVRLPGSGGACEMAIHAKRVVIIATQNLKTFPETVDFITSPGQKANGKTRKDWGLPGGGPTLLITNLGVFKFDSESGEIFLTEIHPGVERSDVVSTIGWNLQMAGDVTETPEPTADELRIIREELDPDHLYI